MFKTLSLGLLVAAAYGQSLNETIVKNNDTLSTFASLLSGYPSLLSSLASASNITILAPSNDAFSALLNTTAGQAAANDSALLQAILTYHVLNGTYEASAIPTNITFVPSLLTNSSYTNVTGGQVVGAIRSGNDVTFISGLGANSSVQTANVNFTGGVIHVIDSVLTLPENASATAVAANLTALAGALTKADLVDTVDDLKDVTIFAPSNAAFAAVGSAFSNATTAELTSVLTYHVVNGTVGYSSVLRNGLELTTVNGAKVTIRIQDGTVFVNGAEVILPNVLIANGVVHVIDNVLNPNNTSASPSASATAGSPGFSGASSVSNTPFASTSPTGSSGSGSGSGASSASDNLAAPMKTGAVGVAALFGAAAFAVNM